jgi:membrane fusion protein, multidrug efflux system
MASLGAVMAETKGIRKKRPLGLVIALFIITATFVFAVKTLSTASLSTDDASIDAEVVHVASPVGGRMIELPVRENQLVHQGDLLFRIDPVPYQNVVAGARAQLDVARAAVSSKQRLVESERWNAEIASEQIGRARENLALSQRTQDRLGPLTARGYIPQQQFDQAKVTTTDAATSLAQAERQNDAAHSLVDTADAAIANVRAAEAALTNALRALQDTEVKAPHDGRVTGLKVSTGEVIAPSQSLFTLINTEEWYATANFREIDLGRVRPGNCATVYSLIDRRTAIKGVVDSIGYGVLADDKIDIPREVPYVQPSLNWVRVAHRFPVRVRLEGPPQNLVRLGASALVEIGHGSQCR